MKIFNETGQQLYEKAKKLIPGGTQLLSKRPEMFAPNLWPAYFSEAKGCHIKDLQGEEFLDMSIMGVGAAILGYSDNYVDDAVIQSIKNGVNTSLNTPKEVELAELMIKLHPWADMVRYARSGGEAMAIAIRIARAKTKKQVVLFSGYHGWEDWYISSNLGDENALDGQLMPGLQPNGIPRALKGTSLPFSLGNLDTFYDDFYSVKDDIAAIVIEPARGHQAPKESLLKLKEIAKEIGAILIFDEITSGFRMCPGGIHRNYGINPDIAVFAKSIANGYAMSLVLGSESVMQSAQTTFISSTNWTESIGPTAALATIQKYIDNNVHNHIIHIGQQVQQLWKTKADKYKLDLTVSGIPSLAAMSFTGKHSLELNTILVTEMLKLKILGFRQFKPSYAHKPEHIKEYEDAVDYVFDRISKYGLELLESPPAHIGFSRLEGSKE